MWLRATKLIKNYMGEVPPRFPKCLTARVETEKITRRYTVTFCYVWLRTSKLRKSYMERSSPVFRSACQQTEILFKINCLYFIIFLGFVHIIYSYANSTTIKKAIRVLWKHSEFKIEFGKNKLRSWLKYF